MRVEYEIVNKDEGSSLRFLYQKTRIKDYVWEYHYHPEMEITTVFSGTGTCHVGNNISTYNDGILVLLGGGLPHSGFGLNASEPHEEIFIQVDEPSLIKLIKDLPEMNKIISLIEKSKYGLKFGEKTQKAITNKLIKLIDCNSFQKCIGMLEILDMMSFKSDYTLLNEQIIDSENIHKHKARLQKIFTYVEQHFAEEIDMLKVAETVQLSIPSFCNYFKKATHINFTEFVNNYRIQKACLLLRQDYTIAELSYQIGFNNVAYFNKVFKLIIGHTPTEYRKIHFNSEAIS